MEEQKENEISKTSSIKERYSGFIYGKCLWNSVSSFNFKCLKKKLHLYEVSPVDSNQDFKYRVEILNECFSCTCAYLKRWA